MIQTQPGLKKFSTKALSGLVFSLPQPIIFNRNTPYLVLTQNAQKQQKNSKDNSSNNIIMQKYTISTPAKKKKRSLSIGTIQKQKDKQKQIPKIINQSYAYESNSKNNAKLMLKQTLYKKFMEKTKNYDGFLENINTNCKIEYETKDHSNVKLRQLNLVVLSKREQIMRNMKSKSDKQKVQQKNGQSLPQFGRSKSSFYKPHQSDYNTLSFLSKTIFTQIQNHYTARFPRQKSIQPLQLGISKAKIINKDEKKIKKRKRNLQFNRIKNAEEIDYDQSIFQKFNTNKIIPHVKINSYHSIAVNNVKKNILTRKKTELKGWDEEIIDDNLDIQPENYNGISSLLHQ